MSRARKSRSPWAAAADDARHNLTPATARSGQRTTRNREMPDPMRIRANAQGDAVDVRVLMSHEMETGQRKDSSGNVVPAHFISNVTVVYAGKTVLSAEWGPAISKNPYLQFKFQGG